jgi:hypothetical protein
VSDTPAHQRLKEQVRERDEHQCVVCGKYAFDVHHVLSRNLLRGKRTLPLLWAMFNMCVLCEDCHRNGNTSWMRKKLLGILAVRFPKYIGYYTTEPEFASRFLE